MARGWLGASVSYIVQLAPFSWANTEQPRGEAHKINSASWKWPSDVRSNDEINEMTETTENLEVVSSAAPKFAMVFRQTGEERKKWSLPIASSKRHD